MARAIIPTDSPNLPSEALLSHQTSSGRTIGEILTEWGFGDLFLEPEAASRNTTSREDCNGETRTAE